MANPIVDPNKKPKPPVVPQQQQPVQQQVPQKPVAAPKAPAATNPKQPVANVAKPAAPVNKPAQPITISREQWDRYNEWANNPLSKVFPYASNSAFNVPKQQQQPLQPQQVTQAKPIPSPMQRTRKGLRPIGAIRNAKGGVQRYIFNEKELKALPKDMQSLYKPIEEVRGYASITPAWKPNPNQSMAHIPQGVDWSSDEWAGKEIDYYGSQEAFLKANPGYDYGPKGYEGLFPRKKPDANALIDIHGTLVREADLPVNWQKQYQLAKNMYSNQQSFVEAVGVQGDNGSALSNALDNLYGTSAPVYRDQITKKLDEFERARQDAMQKGDAFNAALWGAKIKSLKEGYRKFTGDIYRRTYDKFQFGGIANKTINDYTGASVNMIEENPNVFGVTKADISRANRNAFIGASAVGTTAALASFTPLAPLVTAAGTWSTLGASGATFYYKNQADKARLEGDVEKQQYYEDKLRSAAAISSLTSPMLMGSMVGGLTRGAAGMVSKAIGHTPTTTAAQAATNTVLANTAGKVMSKLPGVVTKPLQVTGTTAKKIFQISASPVTQIPLSIAGGFLGAYEGFDTADRMIAWAGGANKEQLNIMKLSQSTQLLDKAYEEAAGNPELERAFYGGLDESYRTQYNKLIDEYKGNIPQDKLNRLISDTYFNRGVVSGTFLNSDQWINASVDQKQAWITQLATARAISAYGLGGTEGEYAVSSSGMKGLRDKFNADPKGTMDILWRSDERFRTEINACIQALSYNDLMGFAKNSSKDGGAGMQLFSNVVASDPAYAGRLLTDSINYYSAHPDALQNASSNKELIGMVNQVVSSIESGKGGFDALVNNMKDPTGVLNKAGILIASMERKGMSLPPGLAHLKDKADDIAKAIFKKDPLKAIPVFASLWIRRTFGEGADGIANFFQNPAAFYLSAGAIALGGVGLAQSFLASDDDPRGDEDSDLDYDEQAYRRRVKRHHSNSIYDNLLGNFGAQ